MNQISTRSNNFIVILHLSDLHFNGNESCQSLIDRRGVFGSLINEIKSLNEGWRPNVVCITGDIAYQNKQSGYEEAIKWLNELLQQLSIEKEAVFVCPGNHDVDREKSSFLVRPHDAGEADRVLRLPIAGHYRSLFVRYEEFCKALTLHPYSFNGTQEFVIGSRIYKDTKFVCNNSSWCSMDKKDKGSLWLGLNFIKSLDLPLISSPTFPITIALIHHPKEYYNVSELNQYDDRNATIDYLASRCHIMLTGHAHGRPRKPDIIYDNAIIFSGGCYESDRYPNSCSLIRLWPERLCIDYRQYEWKGGQSKWSIFEEESNYKLRIKEKSDNRACQVTKEIQQGIEAKPKKEYSKEEIEEIRNIICNHVNSLDYPKAIDVYKKNQDVFETYKEKYKEWIQQIEILISEAKNE